MGLSSLFVLDTDAASGASGRGGRVYAETAPIYLPLSASGASKRSDRVLHTHLFPLLGAHVEARNGQVSRAVGESERAFDFGKAATVGGHHE